MSYQCESLSLFIYSLVCFSYSSILTSKLPVILVHTWFHWNQQKSVKCLKKAELGTRLLFICDKMFFSSTQPISLAYCTPLNGVVLHYQWEIKAVHRYCSMNKMPFPVCILKISFYHDKSHLFNDISFKISLVKQGQALLWMLWNAFSLSLHQFSLMNLTRAKSG